MNEDFYFEIFLSGTPSGFSFIGKQEDKEFLQKFYNTKENQEKEFLQIERKNNDIYYSFVVYGIAGYEDREGGLFNLTLKTTGGYFVDACLLYNKMLGIYNNHILNNIIKGGKYIIDNFANQGKFHKEIESVFYKLISDNKNYISPLKEIDIARNNNLYQCNPIDISTVLTKKLLQNYNKINVSSEYTTKDTELKNLKAMKDKKDKEISEIKEEHNKYCKKLESKITDLENEVKNHQQRIQQCEKTLNDIKEKTDNLSKNIENYNNETNKTCQGKECHNSNHSQTKSDDIGDKSDSRKRISCFTKKQNLLIYCVIIFCIILLIQVGKLSSNIKELKLSTNNIENTYTAIRVDTTSFIKEYKHQNRVKTRFYYLR